MKVKFNAVNLLVGCNLVIFLLMNYLQFIPRGLFALYYPENPQFHLWQFISYLFLHGGFAHLLFNMFALISFGTVLESKWGTRRFLIFYFITGIGAAVIYTLVNYFQFSTTYDQLLALGQTNQQIQTILSTGNVSNEILDSISKSQLTEFFSTFHAPAVGASGAIYGILMAFAITYPNAKLALIFLPVPISAKYFVPILIGGDLFFGLTSYSIGNVAHFAHIGGAIFGLIIMLIWRQKRHSGSIL